MTQANEGKTPTLFLDFEASSLGKHSYPISVAYTLPNTNEVEEHLIKPRADWTDWSYEAQALHGITRERLLADGQEARSVALRMNEALRGQTLLTDALNYDQFWLERLFLDLDFDPEFQLQDFWFALSAVAPDFRLNLERIQEQAAGLAGGRRHDAADDVRRLRWVWILSCGG